MAQYKLHCIGASGNSYKVALYLNCAGLDWEPVGVDFAGGQTRDAKWRADINSMGEIPVLEVSGKRMSQSGAILLWLAETTGKFAPISGHGFEAMRWLSFDNHKFSNNYAMHRVQNCMTPQAVDPAFQHVEAQAITTAIVRYATTTDPGSGFVTPYPRVTPAGPGGGSDGCVDPPLG